MRCCDAPGAPVSSARPRSGRHFHRPARQVVEDTPVQDEATADGRLGRSSQRTSCLFPSGRHCGPVHRLPTRHRCHRDFGHQDDGALVQRSIQIVPTQTTSWFSRRSRGNALGKLDPLSLASARSSAFVGPQRAIRFVGLQQGTTATTSFPATDLPLEVPERAVHPHYSLRAPPRKPRQQGRVPTRHRLLTGCGGSIMDAASGR